MTACRVLLLCAFCVGCHGQKTDAPPTGTGTESLHDLMENMEQAAKPLLSRAPGAPLTEQEVPALVAAAKKTSALAATVKNRFASKQPPSFAGYSDQLEQGLQQVLAALTAQDAKAVQAAGQSVGSACGSCHKEFKQ